MNKHKAPTLDERIANALGNTQITSAEVTELIAETEPALAAAEAKAQVEGERALDPVAAPDAAEAERSAWAAELLCGGGAPS
jgi:hypothetical protein